MKPKTGGPAFPDVQFTHNNGDTSFKNNGMSLRDWLAGQALAVAYPSCTYDPAKTAKRCYELADAMIGERDK